MVRLKYISYTTDIVLESDLYIFAQDNLSFYSSELSSWKNSDRFPVETQFYFWL